ncbi:MAG: S1 RNA-binding domain-containing protein, partial [Chitinivibrionales bacterium]|nr:S1 RNA-binding domain-containing protein [Chitinivibrionales bacterium]
LDKPGRDPRAEFTYAVFDDKIQEISDLAPDMVLEGTVTNVANFGAFVDIGVHQDGLVHISQMANRFVKDPRQVVKVGQVVKVRVLEVDEELNRISLSMRLEKDGGGRQQERSGKPQHRRQPDSSSSRPQQKGNRHDNKPKKLVTCKPKFSLRQFMK